MLLSYIGVQTFETYAGISKEGDGNQQDSGNDALVFFLVCTTLDVSS